MLIAGGVVSPRVIYLLILMSLSHVALAKGSEPIYEDPFDIGSGGASLTRASQAGMIFSNPALIPYGPGFHRWFGNETTLVIGKDSVDFARSMQSSSGGNSGTAEFVGKVMSTPLHAGLVNNFAYVNSVFGFSTFSRNTFDIAAKKFGDTGLPAVRLRAESYQGVAISGASMALTKMISFGATAKYLYAGEPDLAIELTDTAALQALQTPAGLRSMVSPNMGYGYDAGLLLFKQGYNSDFRLAIKVDDIGGTKLSGDGSLKLLRQTYHVGLGYTLHTGTDAIHLSFDYRDVRKAYNEEIFKRARMGAKFILRQHVALGVGYYDGWPSYALELDAWLVRLTGAMYTRELGNKPGLDPRTIYALGFTMGL